MAIREKSKLLGSVRARFAFWFTFVLAGALIIFSVAVYFAMWHALDTQMESALHDGTLALAENLDHEFEEGGSVQEAANSVVLESNFHNLAVRIYAPGGEVLAASDGFSAPGIDIDGGALHSIKASKTFARLEALDTDDFKIGAIAVVDEATKNIYTMVVGANQTSVQRELGTLRTLLITLAPILLVLAAIGGFYLAKRALRPVAVMTAQAKRMNTGNLSERLTVAQSNDELGELASTFNELFARIEKSFVQMRQFMADASHELRTPVAVIRTEAEVALTAPRSESEAFASLKVINDEALRLSRLVEDMFALARADAGLENIRTDEKVAMHELIQSCARAAQTLGRSKEIEVLVNDEISDTVFCSGDRTRLSQLLLNLLDNAIKYTQRGGEVTMNAVTKRVIDDFVVEITIADNGPGIPKEYREKVFERFFRIDVARTRTGTGLGLPIAREIARLHKGSLVLGSDSDRGSQFKLTLPITDLKADSKPARASFSVQAD